MVKVQVAVNYKSSQNEHVVGTKRLGGFKWGMVSIALQREVARAILHDKGGDLANIFLEPCPTSIMIILHLYAACKVKMSRNNKLKTKFINNFEILISKINLRRKEGRN